MTGRLRTTGQLFAVVDDPADAPAIIRELVAAGVEPEGISLLRGPAGAARIDASGAATGVQARVRQALSFTLVDQMPDFILYEAALLDGRSVLAIRVASEDGKRRVLGVLRAGGAHFINYFGRFATEELDLWRGPELAIPGVLRR